MQRNPAPALGLFIGALVLAGGGCSHLARPENRAERVVFASARDGNTDIYIAAVDGSGLRRLTRDPAPDQIPRCSPDGRHIVFVRGQGAAAEIHRLDLRDGSELRLTHNGHQDNTPNWSADGSQLYFTRRIGDHDRIAVMPALGGEARDLTANTWHDTMPGASPDGRSLVFHTYRYGSDGSDLQLLDLASGRERRLTQAPAYDYEAAFAGSGAVVLSSNRDGGHYRLYVTTLDGAPRLLADTGADAWGPRYSHRSDAVLFYTGKPGAWRLMRVPLGGGPARPVLDDGQSNSGGDWCRPA